MILMIGFLVCNTVGWIIYAYAYFHSEEWEHRKWVRSVMKSDELTKEEKKQFYLKEVIMKKSPFIIR